MRAIVLTSLAASVLIGCSAARARDDALLQAIDGKEAMAAIKELQSSESGDLCTLQLEDGRMLLISVGRQAVAHAAGKPVRLTYQALLGGEASFTGVGVRISGHLRREVMQEDASDVLKTRTRKAVAQVHARGRTDAVEGRWVCQKALLKVRTP